jgi:hypothetical protein
MQLKSYTDLEQSRNLAKILPLGSADAYIGNYVGKSGKVDGTNVHYYHRDESFGAPEIIYAWSLAALLKYLSEIEPQVYTPILFPSEGKWILQFVEYGHGNVCEISCNNPIDTCYETIMHLNKLKIL